MNKGIAIAIIISLSVLVPPAYASGGGEIDVLHYDIHLQIFPDKHRFNVVAFVKLKGLENNVKNIEFSLNKDLQIDVIKRGSRILNYDRHGNKITVFFDLPLNENEERELIFEYSGIADAKPESGESVWGYIGNEGSYMVYEAIWYPTIWDDRATAVVRIRVPDGQAGLSIGDLVDVVKGGKYNEFVWEINIPTGGISFAVGDYIGKTTFFGHMPIIVYTYPMDIYSSEKSLKKSKDILDFYSSVFGKYPYPSFTIVEIPEFFMGGHGDQGMIMLYSRAFREELSSDFLAHEIAHNWWGALVSAKGEHSLRSSEGFKIFSKAEKRKLQDRKEHNLWLHEGFATYSSILYTEYEGGREEMIASLNDVRREYLSKIEYYPDEPIINAEEEYGKGAYHAIVYGKGALVLHMLRYVVGDEIFLKIMNTYAQRYEGKSATIKDFQTICEEASGRDLDWFFEEWIRKTTLPDYVIEGVKVTKISPKYEVKFKILQVGDIAKMPVDITLHTVKSDITKRVWVNKTSEWVSFTTDSKPIYIEVDKDHWILESDRSNNLYVISYPPNLVGVKLFLKEISKRVLLGVNSKVSEASNGWYCGGRCI